MDDILKFKGMMESRLEYFFSIVALNLASLLPEALANSLHSGHGTFAIWFIVALSIIMMAILVDFTYLTISVLKARLNSAGWSGWWMLCPGVNVVVPLFFKAKFEGNKYRGEA